MSAVERCTFNIAQVHFGVAHYHSYIVCSATEGRLGASDPPPGTKWRDWKGETNESVLAFDARSQSRPSRAAMKVRRRSGRRFTFAVWISPNRQFTTSQIRRAGYGVSGPGIRTAGRGVPRSVCPTTGGRARPADCGVD